MTWLLAGAVALAPVYMIRFNIGSYPTTMLEVLIVAFLLSAILQLNIKDLKKIKNLGLFNWAIGMFVLSGVVSVLVSPEKVRALGQLKAYIIEPILVFYAMVLLVKNKDQILKVLQPLFWVAVAISAFGIFQYLSFIYLPVRFWGNGTEVARIISVFEHPNALSLYLAPLLGFFATLWVNDYPLTKNRWNSGLGLLIMGVALVLTFSRGAWIAATIGLLFVLIRRFEFKKVVLPLMLAAILLIFMPGVKDRLSLGVSDASTSAHLDLQKIGLNKLVQSPIFGNGLFGFRTTQIEANYSGEVLNNPHNILLYLWLELGILGLISFVWIIFLSFRQYKQRPHILALAAGVYLMIMLIHGLVDAPYFKNDLSLLFWFMISLFLI